MIKKIPGGIIHTMPADFRKAIESDVKVTSVWLDITPLARNEWICWVTSAKKDKTRKHRIVVGLDKIRKGMRRPCCWAGCPHRKDKALNPSQKFIFGKKSKKINVSISLKKK